MPKLSDLFADLFVCVLLYEERLREDGEPPSCTEMRSEINTLLAEQDRVARGLNIPEQDYQVARFAVLAWIDETILGCSSAECATRAVVSQWQARPMQLEHYQTRQARTELSERLDNLHADQQPVREVYDLCLGLGLTHFRHCETVQATPLLYKDESAISILTPQLYQVPLSDPPPKSKDIRHPTFETARTGASSLGAVFSCLIDKWRTVYRKRLAIGYPRKVGPALLVMIPILLVFLAATLLPPPSPPSESGQQISPSPQQQTVTTPQPDPVDRLVPDRQADPVRPMLSNPIPLSPFQEVRDFLQPLTLQAQAHGLKIMFKPTMSDEVRVNANKDHPTYSTGDSLVIDIQTPTAYSSFVYVEYYDAAGRVAQLFPNPVQQTNHFRPGSTFTLGDPQGPAPWRVSPPAGRDLIVVIASKKPLVRQPNLTPEPVDSALSALRQALQGLSQADVVATFSFLTIHD
ncbi:MAG: DotU family type IV/VI secretion system protein [Candidatus Tectomicrobia bacterium]|nr:DotU family type IV/VI secretion system protein [Candidatus Tectomicrobia bacterium]